MCRSIFEESIVYIDYGVKVYIIRSVIGKHAENKNGHSWR